MGYIFMKLEDYCRVDIDNFTIDISQMTRKDCTVVSIKQDNYHSALAFIIENFGESGEYSWHV